MAPDAVADIRMRLLIGYLPSQRKAITAALLFVVINQVLLMVDPYIFRRIVDDFVVKYRQNPRADMLLGVSLWVGVMLAAVLLSWVGKNNLLATVSRVSHRVSAAMFADGIRHSLELPYLEFEQRRSGETLDRLQRLRTTVERFLTTTVNLLLASVIRVAIVIVYAASVYWLIGLCLLLLAPVLSIASILLSRKVREIEGRLLQENAAQAGSATETLRNIEVVKSLGLAQQEISRLHRSTNRVLNLQLEKTRRVRRLTFYHGAAIHVSRGLVVVLSVYALFMGHMSVGQFLSLYLYFSFMFIPLQDLSEVVAEWRATEVALSSFRDLLETPVEALPAGRADVGTLETLEFDAVTFRYPTAERPALQHLSFRVARGETVAFVGTSGAGKSTLVKLISGLYAPASGRVLYNGIPQDRIDLNAIRQRIGLVTQETQLFAGSIRENLLFAYPDATDDECLLALHQAAADSLLQRGGQGLDSVVGEAGMRLSGGEKQRLAIARALLRRPYLLIFDEATSSLDSITEKEIGETMRHAARATHALTVLIAHRLSTVLDADCIYVIDGGAVVQSGTHAELIETSGLYRELWQRQVGGSPAGEADN